MYTPWTDRLECHSWLGQSTFCEPDRAHWRVRWRHCYAIKSIRGLYRDSRKEPDLLLRPENLKFRTFVIESGWSESYGRLRDDMNLWLVGGGEKTEAVLIIKWQVISNTITVKGYLEVYTRDNQTMPKLQQIEVNFPASPPQAALQRVRLTRKML